MSPFNVPPLAINREVNFGVADVAGIHFAEFATLQAIRF